MMEAVASVGPLAVAIDASLHSFMYYDHGVYRYLLVENWIGTSAFMWSKL